ncbi:histidine kinase [Zhihengliuella sp.]|uniref:sensor histidine kinase n=1 Tax=Zhihengliuella sp. TaxID=1954483 RepID=UPI0028122674|nr:histidine kinase [Zhihengliuella sp.]
MNWHRRVDRWVREHPRSVDLVGALVLWFVTTVASAGVAGGLGAGSQTVLATLLSSAETLPLIWRRSHRRISAAVIVMACLMHLAFLQGFLPSLVAVPMVVYTLAKYGTRWESLSGLGLSLVGAAFSAAAFGGVTADRTFASIVASTVIIGLSMLVVWTYGDLARTRLVALQALHDRAERLEREQVAERAAAAADERARIAREMHDIVAHSLSIMITQADGARYASRSNPAVAVEALETISMQGRESLKDMRRLLGVLRGEDEAQYRPLPGIADLEQLAKQVRLAGQQVDLYMVGSPSRALPNGAELAVYRCVQESLTNVVKHAGTAARATVTIDWTRNGVTVSVTDNGRGALADASTAGSGRGLDGMRERVELYGGQVSAGPLARGGFVVRAFIPYLETA